MATMGRGRSKNFGLPPHMAKKGQQFYFVTNAKKRKWITLGSDWPKALALWARLEGAPIPEQARTFAQVVKWYRENIDSAKAKDADRELARLEDVFGPSPIETIRPSDVKSYLLNRKVTERKGKETPNGRHAPIRANREISRLSHVINCAREAGFTDMANPCAGVRKNKETGRDRYLEDIEFDAIYAKGDALLQDAMDLLLLTSQRPSDVVKMKRNTPMADMMPETLPVKQGKTGNKLRLEVETDLKVAVQRMLDRKRKATGVYLVQDDNGQPITYWQLEKRWSDARTAAAVDMPSVANAQMRDIRGKAATDVNDLAHAQALLGHKTRATTEKYVKQRAGARVKPHQRTKGAA